jgi:hypothetical protein
MTVSRELAGYKMDLVGVHKVSLEGGGTEPAGEYLHCCILYIYIYIHTVCIYIYGKCVENKNFNSKYTHRQMSRL